VFTCVKFKQYLYRMLLLDNQRLHHTITSILELNTTGKSTVKKWVIRSKNLGLQAFQINEVLLLKICENWGHCECTACWYSSPSSSGEDCVIDSSMENYQSQLGLQPYHLQVMQLLS
jgi:hypothetical protein